MFKVLLIGRVVWPFMGGDKTFELLETFLALRNPSSSLSCANR